MNLNYLQADPPRYFIPLIIYEIVNEYDGDWDNYSRESGGFFLHKEDAQAEIDKRDKIFSDKINAFETKMGWEKTKIKSQWKIIPVEVK